MPKPIRRYIKKAVAAEDELKYVDTAAAYAQIDRGATLTAVSTISQGAAQSQRVGDQIKQRKLEFRMDFYLAPGVTDATHHMRVIIFRWHIATSVTTPTLSTILASSGSVNVTCSPYNWQGKKQADFTILMDRKFTVQRYAGQSHFSKILNLKNKNMAFDAGSSAAADHIYVLTVGDDVTGAHTPDIQAQWQTRLWYIDA